MNCPLRVVFWCGWGIVGMYEITPLMNYEEIMKCYEGETDIHASTSFEFGLMNDLYWQLFYSYPEVD